MRVLRGLSSRVLACGCLAGIYETYDGEVVGILDARGKTCVNPFHIEGKKLPADMGPPSEPGDEPRSRS